MKSLLVWIVLTRFNCRKQTHRSVVVRIVVSGNVACVLLFYKHCFPIAFLFEMCVPRTACSAMSIFKISMSHDYVTMYFDMSVIDVVLRDPWQLHQQSPMLAIELQRAAPYAQPACCNHAQEATTSS